MIKIKKKTTSITIDETVLDLATRLGINKSQAAQRGIEAELNMPVELKDLIKRRHELKAELKIIEQRIKIIEDQNEHLQKREEELSESTKQAVEIIMNRMIEQPPVPVQVWKFQATKTGLTISELQALVQKECENLGVVYVH